LTHFLREALDGNKRCCLDVVVSQVWRDGRPGISAGGISPRIDVRWEAIAIPTHDGLDFLRLQSVGFSETLPHERKTT